MSGQSRRNWGRGPFVASQIPEGSRYELSNGHPVYCPPVSGQRGAAVSRGVAIIGSDPKVKSAGADVGYSPEEGTLRAPDVSVLTSEEPGWARGAPPLALEFADTGQDEDELRAKIAELLEAGTREVWVVRLKGTQRVEVHKPDEPIRLAFPGQELLSPEVLALPVPVAAFFDQELANLVALRNLLSRAGYSGLDAVREEGRHEGLQAGRVAAQLQILEARGLELRPDQLARVRGCADESTLSRWTLLAPRADTTDEVLGG